MHHIDLVLVLVAVIHHVCSAWQKSSVGSSNTRGEGNNAVSDVSDSTSTTTTKPWGSSNFAMEEAEEDNDKEVENHDEEDLDESENVISNELKLVAQDEP